MSLEFEFDAELRRFYDVLNVYFSPIKQPPQNSHFEKKEPGGLHKLWYFYARVKS